MTQMAVVMAAAVVVAMAVALIVKMAKTRTTAAKVAK